MTKGLRMLLAEDSEEDEALLLREMARSGYALTHQRVETAEGMRAALAARTWDVVISDYTMPAFSAIEALEVLHRSGLDLPFIICSGTIGEDAAITALKAGAHDFVVKGRYARLIPAIERELREAAGREERRRAERALQQSERKYRRIVETSQEGIWTVDDAGRTTYVNRRMADMLGVPADQMPGVSLFEFCDRGGDDSDGHPFDIRPDRPERPEQREVQFRRRDGSEFWASVSTSPAIDEAGRYGGLLLMVTDMTERRKLQAQVMASDRMASIGTMAAGLAHEINNPLAAVVANIDLARAALDRAGPAMVRARELAELDESLHDAQEASARVRDIIRDVKLFSRADDEVSAPVDLRRVLDSSARMARAEVRHRAALIRNFHEVPLVEGNESRLGQVFLNLIVNAAQAIPEGQVDGNHIELRTDTDRSDGNAVVEVIDSGAGMPPEVLRRLFTPFFTTKPPGLGTGLGLSICQRVVKAMGGEIAAESHPGKGTTFRVRLPPARATEAALDRPARNGNATEPAGPAAARSGRVLVVDDEPMIASALKRCLSGRHQVTVVNAAQDALELIRRGDHYDVIVCDLMMPQMTGMELHEHLTRMAPEVADRMIFLSGGAFTQRARAFLEEVRNARLEKPFDSATLRALVDEKVAAASVGADSSQQSAVS